MPEEGTTSIHDLGRIQRMLEKIISLRLPLTIRKKGEDSLHIRGNAFAMSPMQWNGKAYTGFQINQISEKGISLLSNEEPIKIECPLVNSKLEFISTIHRLEKDSIWISCPQNVTNIERRKNARFKPSPSTMGYVRFCEEWDKKIDGYTLPCFPFYAKFDSLLWIVDISPSGVCIETSLPFLFYALKKFMQDKSSPLAAALQLPLQPTLSLSLVLRWMKKTRDASGHEHSLKEPKTTYRFGCEFDESSQVEREPLIREYLEQISMADAI